MIEKKKIIKWALGTLWVSIGVGVIVLLVAAIQKKDAQHCANVYINIEGVDNNFFVDKKDILNSITASVGGNPVGKAVGTFDLKAIETGLKKNVWVKKAQLFFDNNQVLQVHVFEREPMARVFTTSGTTFYIDSSIAMLPLSEKYSARLPVFTNFPSDKSVLAKEDSALLRDILTMSNAIQKDTFCMAMIDQIDITNQRTFLLIPKIGTQVIVFGDGSDAEEKLKKLKLFYKDAMTKAGWNYYSEINVQFKNQVVAKRRGAEDVASDSLRTLQLMQLIAANAEKLSTDSMQRMLPDNDPGAANNELILQSIEREDNAEVAEADGKTVSPAATLSKALPLKAVVTKPVVTNAAPVKKVVADKNTKPTTVNKPTAKQPVVKQPAKIIKPLSKPISKPQVRPAVPKKPPAKPNNDY